MHICYLSLDFHKGNEGGGIASYVQTLASELVARGHQVSIVARGRKPHWEETSGLRILFWPMGNLHWYGSRIPFIERFTLSVRELEWSYGMWEAVAEVNRNRPIDILECCETGIFFVHALKIPLVIRLHGEPYIFAKHSGHSLHFGFKLYRQMELGSLRRASMITSPSHFHAKEIAIDLSWSEERIEVIPNPISPSTLKYADPTYAGTNSSQRLAGLENKSIVLYTGRIQHSKGTIPLLKSVKQVINAFPNAHYVIAGARHNSISTKDLDRILDGDAIRSHVSILGHVPWHDLAAIYRQTSIFVMPSYYETFGISVIEAMAFGLPVVATTAGGLPEVVENEISGLLVHPGEPTELGEAVIRLLKNPELGARLGQVGRKIVIEKYAAAQIADRTITLYNRIRSN